MVAAPAACVLLKRLLLEGLAVLQLLLAALPALVLRLQPQPLGRRQGLHRPR